MAGNLSKEKDFKGLIKAGKIFRVLFWLSIVYVAIMVITHWVYFFTKNMSAGIKMSVTAGIFSTLAYLAAGLIAACIFYAVSEIIELLSIINAKIRK